jgi:hypothetical protein
MMRQDEDETVIDGYYAACGAGPFAVPVDPADTLHDGYQPIRRRRPGERRIRLRVRRIRAWRAGEPAWCIGGFGSV